MLWVLVFWVMALGYSCNKSGIRCLKTLRALLVRVGNKWSWFWPRVSIWYNSLLSVNIVPKYPGSDLFTNLYQNFIHWTSNISLTFSISSSLNNGSVWALYLLFVIMRRARFCSLNILFHSKPQHVIHWWTQINQENILKYIILLVHDHPWFDYITVDHVIIVYIAFWTMIAYIRIAFNTCHAIKRLLTGYNVFLSFMRKDLNYLRHLSVKDL